MPTSVVCIASEYLMIIRSHRNIRRLEDGVRCILYKAFKSQPEVLFSTCLILLLFPPLTISGICKSFFCSSVLSVLSLSRRALIRSASVLMIIFTINLANQISSSIHLCLLLSIMLTALPDAPAKLYTHHHNHVDDA